MQGEQHHPWRILRGHTNVDLIWSDLDIGLHGQTTGDVIELDSRLGQAERRCALAHELDHYEHGHWCSQDEAVERQVRERVARKLIPITVLAQAMAYSMDPDEVAFDLWVTRQVLDDRMQTLTEDETAAVRSATQHHRDHA